MMWDRKSYLREYNRKYRASHKKELAAATLAWKRSHSKRSKEIQAGVDSRIRDYIFTLYGDCCLRCGFTDRRALQLDHIHGAKGQRRVGKWRAGKSLYSAIRRGDIDKSEFQLLCANCNWIKRVEKKEFNSRYYHD